MSPHFRIRIFAGGLALTTLVLAGATALRAGNLTRGGSSSPAASGSAAASGSQTATAATAATTSAAQTATMNQRAQISLQRSMQSMQVIQAQAAAQSAARNLTFSTGSANNLGTVIQPLPDVPNGLAPNGLVPGVAGVDPADPGTIAVSVPVTANAGGTASVTLGANSALTLPPGAASASQVTVSGTGTVGSITTGGTITPLVAGVATSVPAGSTISLTNGGTVTFGAGSSIPSSVSTYAYTGAGATVPVPISWTGVGGLSQATYAAGAGQSSGSTTVTVTQTQQQALLTWQSFNVGRNTTLDFDQSLGGSGVANWVAINKVADNIAPSQILGAIQGPGQVYVLNQNGILFGGSSQINLGALVASSLPINDNLVQNGLLDNPDFQFLFSQLNIAAGTQGPTAAFTPAAAPNANGNNSDLVAHVDSLGNLSLTPAAGLDGDVVVEPGAQLTSPATAQNVGGRIALIGPNVNNGGTISTPDGQTILAAGMQVGFVAHNANDPSLRGLDTYVGAVTDPSVANPPYATGVASNTGVIGTMTTAGTIEATPGADLTMAGQEVDQSGVVDLSTSINLNSRLDLLADYNTEALVKGVAGFSGTTGFYPTATGTVNLGANSVTALTPDLGSTDTVVGTQLALPSLVNVQGLSINLLPGALLSAPGAALPSDASTQPALTLAGTVLTAGLTLDAGSWIFSGNSDNFSNTTGEVTLDPNATIDVSGSENVDASVAEDIVAVQLLGTQLANSPLQQDGALRGQTVYVDLRDVGTYDGTAWIGTPLADASGYANLVQRTAGELTDSGGTVAINAGASVTLAAGSTVDVSGGWINYAGATVPTTQVISNGQLINIAQATPNLVYGGIYQGLVLPDTKYGLTQTYSNPFQNGTQYDPGFVQGGSGGTLSINAPSLQLQGSLQGNTVAGAYQRTAASVYDAGSSAYANASFRPTIDALLAVPTLSDLSIGVQGKGPNGAATDPATPENVDFGTGPAGDLVLSPDLGSQGGFGTIAIVDPTGSITVAADSPIVLPPGGALTLAGANIDVESDVTAPAGSLDFTAYEVSPYDTITSLAITPPTADSPAGAVSAFGNFTLGASVVLETAGLTVNDSAGSPTAGALPKLTSGGSVSIDGYSVFLDPNSQIDASGGVYLSASGSPTYGNAGKISIVAGEDATNTFLTGGVLDLGSALSAYSGVVGGGGSLTIQAPLVQIGGSLAGGLLNGDSNSVAPEGSGIYGDGTTLWLDPSGAGQPDFFSQGGFESFAIEGVGVAAANSTFDTALLIAPGTIIDPTVESYPVSAGLNLAPMTVAQELQLLPSERSPVNLSFSALGVSSGNILFANPGVQIRGDLVVGAGSVVETDPQDISSANGVSFSAGVGTVTILGDVMAPGGTISVKGAGDSRSLLFPIGAVTPTIDLGSASELSTAGVVEYTQNSQGYATGSVLAGGAISLSGNIVAQQGAVLDVSGTSGTVDVLPAQTGTVIMGTLQAPAEVPLAESSNGGSITLAGAQELFVDATLLGQAGGPSAQGGSLTVYSGEANSGVETPTEATLVVTQSGDTFVEPAAGQTLIGMEVTPTHPLNDDTGVAIDAYFAADPNIFASSAVDGGNGGQAGGFQSLNLERTVQFSGPVTIDAGASIAVGDTVSSDTISGGVIYADSPVVLQAPLVSLGLSFTTPFTTTAVTQSTVFSGGAIDPSTGPGSLTVNASALTEIGNLSLQDIGTVNVNTTPAHTAVSVAAGTVVPVTGGGTIVSTSGGTITAANGTTSTLQAGVATTVAAGSSVTLSQNGSITPEASGIIPARAAGDVEGDGTFDLVGSIAITAAQVYPPTESIFSIFDYDPTGATGDGLVVFTRPLGSDTLPSLPLSAGGTLNVYASNIIQDGVLRAPDGTINLGVGVVSSTPIDFLTGSGVGGSIAPGAPPVPTAIAVTLGPEAVTSVSLVDPNTGEGIEVPYGIVNDSGDWIDPAGNDITSAGNGPLGLPDKAIEISGQTVVDEPGSSIDLRGGGDLFAYQFVSGTGGTNDILASDSSFAVVPGYDAAYAPYGPYASGSSLETNGVADAGYTNPDIALGEQIYLSGSSGLAAGVYTVLPARYALLPGAYLVNAANVVQATSQLQANGSSYVTGYTFNGLSNSTLAAPPETEFQVQAQPVVEAEADYQVSDANAFFTQIATTNNRVAPRLPQDAGQLVLVAGSLALPSAAGSLLEAPASGGLGGEVDIASSENINIYNSANPDTGAVAGDLNLDSNELTDFDAASLVVGGYRSSGSAATALAAIGSALTVPSTGGTITFPSGTPGSDTITVSGTGVVGTYTTPAGVTSSVTGGTATSIPAGSILSLTSGGTVTFANGTGGAIPLSVAVNGTGLSVTTGQLTVNNAGTSLTGSDIVLVSNGGLTVEAGSSIAASASGAGTTAEPLALVGNGTLLRVSSDGGATITRSSVHASVSADPADMQILASPGLSTTISGGAAGSIILDSTNETSLASSGVSLGGASAALDSGQISIELTTPLATPSTTGLVLSGGALANLQADADSLSLLSYSSIDIYSSGSGADAGVIGAAANAQGNYAVNSLALHATDLRGFDGGDVTINARNVTLDNSSGSTAIGASGASDASAGTLTVNAQNLDLGMNTLEVEQFANVDLNASGGVTLTGLGAQGTTDTSVTATAPTASALAVSGNLNIDTPVISAQNTSPNAGPGFTSFVDEAIRALGAVTLGNTGAAGTTPSSAELGAMLLVSGSSVTDGTMIALPSGTVTLAATGTGAGSDVDIDSNGAIDVAGISPSFLDLAKYTNGGSVTLTSASGNVNVDGLVDVGAASGTGTSDSVAANAGSLTIEATAGTLTVGGTIQGQAGVVTSADGAVLSQGTGGNFSLDAGSLADGSFDALEVALNPVATGPVAGDAYVGGFTNSQSIRLRSGSLTIDGVVAATTVNLSVDNGYIEVTGSGRIDATASVDGLIDTTTGTQTENGAAVTTLTNPGLTGGSVTLAAGVATPGSVDSASGLSLGSVVLDSGSLVSTAGQFFNDAGRGGSVTLQAGADLNGSTPSTGTSRGGNGSFGAGVAVVDVRQGATVDLSVKYLPIQLDASGGSSVDLASAGSVFFPQGTPGNDQVTISGGSGTVGTLVTAAGATTTLTAGMTLSVPAGATIRFSQPGETIAFAGGGTGGAIALDLPATADFTSTGASNPQGNAALTAAQQGDLAGTLTVEAPQTSNQADVQVDPIDGAVVDASGIAVEGLFVQNANSTSSVSLDNSSGTAGSGNGTNYENVALQNAAAFASSANSSAMQAALTGADSQGVSGLVEIRPAEEIDNTQGGLGLNSTWDFSQGDRYGVNSDQPGLLILRAEGNLTIAFNASLTDGFDLSEATGGQAYTAPLMSGLSWGYDLVAGGDFSAADVDTVTANGGSFVLGAGTPALPKGTLTITTVLSTDHFYQAIRTGTGNITISSGGNVEIENELATIYTAGTLAPSVDGFDTPFIPSTTANPNPYGTYFSWEGGNVSISALGNIGHYTTTGAADSAKELPTNWLYRQGATANGVFAGNIDVPSDIESTAWWVSFNNFLEGVGALGGGNVVLEAGGNVVNLDAVAPTNARMPGDNGSGEGIAPDAASLVELGGGDVTVEAGNNIDAGVYYVEQGEGTLDAGNQIVTNSTRAALVTSGNVNADPYSWLPTTLFAGDASFTVSGDGGVLLGPVANPLLLPQSLYNGVNNKSYFSTYAASDTIDVSSLAGTVEIKDDGDTSSANTPGDGSLYNWYANVFLAAGSSSLGNSSQPWLKIVETSLVSSFSTTTAVMPPTLLATAYSGDIDLVGNLLLAPSPDGTIDLAASGSVNGYEPNTEISSVAYWGTSLIDLSDANPASIPGVASPLSSTTISSSPATFSALNAVFAESGATQGVSLQTEENLHADIDGEPLHADDPNPVHIYAQDGDISGLTLFSGKFSDIVAGQDITDIGLYLQNDNAGQTSIVDAGEDLVAYDPATALRFDAQAIGNQFLGESTSNPLGNGKGAPNTGDIQIGGPGTLEILAGDDITLGEGPANTTGPNGTSNGTDTGFTSIGNLRNPVFPASESGADIITGAGIGGAALGLDGANPTTQIAFAKFEDEFLNPDPADNPADASDAQNESIDPGNTQSDRYLPDLGTLLGLQNGTTAQIWSAFRQLPASRQDALALDVYYLVLRDSGRDHNLGLSPNYAAAMQAVAALFPGPSYAGDISLSSREIKTESGGNIDLFAPGGGVVVGFDLAEQPVDQGILTDEGGNIGIFVQNDVTVGTSRIFTLDGGNIVIYSSDGSIAAGSASKTVQSAPPTRVLVDSQSGAVETDLAGLATGGGIGVLESQTGAQTGDVDLIAPKGTVDAGDAGIRVSGNLNIAAVQVLNAGNISVGGKSAGVPTTTTPNLAGLSAASSAAGAGANTASDLARQQQQGQSGSQDDVPSIITVEVIGYGGA